ncbi:tRNA (adenosine(37)-N6)-threonylcarbamoyltransferase complex ATPase subunit type 1 TsaE [Tunicatimonas pelagia]|uniref:tRNA (adenosine(37)-N6)-threonylcarbamoyltransferase complex ATPase subunit type 1 TsaE n=1 Tax=Tunicatimonas pelagia TaxID=931531 RepID=UPI00266586DC|nr:tRNA (adenosine(37)-N6)-threonylcarbamoyltransferase complex ATPase subunit type 1 TsaE [Tunicatimonas pelagia]WKN41524.1 tRNA (adenosine(37)-N6)-threonylcarbamoyltransferase complex ATPase subunit type 1 TsaE [Tunicatimonas pelagia]
MPENEWARKTVPEADLSQVAQELINWGNSYDIWLFQGDLGAGKTTLIKELGRQWKVEDQMSSPTFSIVNEYRTSDGQSIYHFDFYRLNHESEAVDIGVEEYFDSESYCLVEWPEKIPNLLPDRHLQIFLEVQPDQSRTIYASQHE